MKDIIQFAQKWQLVQWLQRTLVLALNIANLNRKKIKKMIKIKIIKKHLAYLANLKKNLNKIF